MSVLQPGMDPDFPKEPVGELRVLVEVGQQHIHRLLTVREETAHRERRPSPSLRGPERRSLVVAEDIAELDRHSDQCIAFGHPGSAAKAKARMV